MSISDKKCSVEGCDSKIRCKSLCGLHYQRHRLNIPMDSRRYVTRGKYKICTVDWCTRKYYANRLCALHYRRHKNGLAQDTPIVHAERHGKSGVDMYSTWVGMKQRCTNPKADKYRHYGAKGVKVCDRWLNSFQHFVDDMGEKPSPQYSLDRYPDKEGDYKKSNCRWATQQQQVMNRGLNRNNSSGHKGVYWDKKSRSYVATIGLDYKTIHIGNSKIYEEAIEMRRLAEKKYFKPILDSNDN